MQPSEIYWHFGAYQAALGVLVEIPRLTEVCEKLAENLQDWTPELEVLRTTETYLFLLVANQMGSALNKLPKYKTQHMTKTDLANLRQVRNAWEHRNEKLSQQKFPWNDPHLEDWLDRTYGLNWMSVYSLTVGLEKLEIGNVVSVPLVGQEAQTYVDYFEASDWSRNDAPDLPKTAPQE